MSERGYRGAYVGRKVPREERQHLYSMTLGGLRLLDPRRLLHRAPDICVSPVLGVEVVARDELVAAAVGLTDATRAAGGVGLVRHPAYTHNTMHSESDDTCF